MWKIVNVAHNICIYIPYMVCQKVSNSGLFVLQLFLRILIVYIQKLEAYFCCFFNYAVQNFRIRNIFSYTGYQTYVLLQIFGACKKSDWLTGYKATLNRFCNKPSYL